MSLNSAIALDPPTCRWLRRCAPLVVVTGLLALALTPGVIAGDRPHEVSFCADQPVQACTELQQALVMVATTKRN